MGMTDRELDVLVAEKIFGCRTEWDCGFCVDGLDHEEHGDRRPWCNCEKAKHYSDSEGLDILPYSTDLASAMIAASKVCEPLERVHLHIVWRDGKYACATFKKHPVGFGGYQELAYHEDENGNVARAICLAALKAVGVEVES